MRISTLNLNCHNTWSQKSTQLLETLKNLNSDVYCFQELSSKLENVNGNEKIVNDATEICAQLNLQGYFSAPYKCAPSQGNFYKESSFDSVEGFHFNFNGLLDNGVTDNHRRVFIANKFILNTKSFYIINLHLSVTKEFRQENLRQLKIWLKTYTTESDNIFILGDFNNYDQHTADGDIEKSIYELGYKNAWKALRNDQCTTYYGTDWWKSNYPELANTKALIEKNKTYPSTALDYIFYKGSDIKLNVIDYINLVPTVTDHLGLVLDFELL